jgi:hypothetical protein
LKSWIVSPLEAVPVPSEVHATFRPLYDSSFAGNSLIAHEFVVAPAGPPAWTSTAVTNTTAKDNAPNRRPRMCHPPRN